jgi:MFS family permease
MSTMDAKRTIFAVTVIGNLIAMLDSTSVNLALYPISKDLGVQIEQAQWVIIAYMLVLTMFLPFFGKLGDKISKNKLYSCGFLVFAAGAVCNALSPSLPLLVFSRCVQALGASAMISNSAAIIASIFHDKNRGKALGLNSAVIALGGMTGPSLGGVLIHYFGWKAIFAPSVPIALAGAYFAHRYLPSYLPPRRKKSENNREIFKNKAFALGNLAIMAAYMCMFSNGVLLPIFLQDIRGFNSMIAGLLVLPYSVGLSVTAPFSGSFAGKHGSQAITMIGAVTMIFALLICLTFDQDSRIPIIMIASAIMGFGSGLFQSPSNTAIMTSVKRSQLGIASGILALSRNLGGIIAVGFTITLFSRLRSVFAASGYTKAFLQSYHLTVCAGILFGVVCLILAYFAYRNDRT